MTEQSPFLRYHQQRHSQNKNHVRGSYEQPPLQNRDKYLQHQLEEPCKSGKKENKLKVFGLSNSKQKKQPMLNPYIISQQSIEINQDHLIQPQSEQLLIETRIDIDLENNQKNDINQLHFDKKDEDAHQQLQKLLQYQEYISNSSALHKENNSNNISKFLGSQQERKENEIQGENLIQQSQQIELQTPIGTQLLDPNIVTKKNIQPLPFTDSVVVSTPQGETQRVSSCIQNKQEIKNNQQIIRTSSKIVLMSQNNSKIADTKINILTEKDQVDQPISRDIFTKKQAENLVIASVPNLCTQIKKRSHDNILKATSYPAKKQQKQITIPIKNTQKEIQQIGQKASIRNYLESYGSYEQQIAKMINKFQKVSNLKQKQILIKDELTKINHNHKRNQSVASAEDYYFTDPYPRTPQYQYQQQKNKEIFAQSLSNFKYSHEDRERGVQQQLRRDVLKMQKIISKFKEISQYVATESPRSSKPKHQLSEKNIRTVNKMKGLPNFSHQYNYQSVEIPHNSHNFNNFTGVLQEQYHNFNNSQQIIDSQERQSMDFREKQKDLWNYDLKNNRTTRTDKKTTNDTQLIQSTNQRFRVQEPIQSGCQSNYLVLIEEIRRLERKIDSIEKQKQQSLKRQAYLETQSIRKDITKDIQNDEAESEIVIQPRRKSLLQEYSIQKGVEQKRKPVTKIVGERNKPNKSNKNIEQQGSLICHQNILSKIPKSSSKQKNVNSFFNLHKDIIQGQNDFLIDLDIEKYKIPFPRPNLRLSKQSSQSAIIEFGEKTFKFFLSFAKTRFKAKKDEKESIKEGFKVKKYQDCIYFYLPNALNFHLIYYFKGKLYFGQWKNGMKHGFGYYYNPNKYIYEGEFSHDQKNGTGTINYNNGDIYSGQWVNNKREGEGVLINSMGDIFKGSFEKGKKNGKGEERLNNGDFYRGQFVVGRPQGEGIYWWADGSVYKGGFQGGLLHGKGIWRSKQNDYYEGQYRLNRKHGKGTYKWSNGLIFTGLFKDDEKLHPNSNMPNLKSNEEQESRKKIVKKRISVEQRHKHR